MMQRLRMKSLLATSLCGLAYAGSAWAHHSIQAQFDVNKQITVSGTVAKVEFINPHSYLTIDVAGADGATTRWAFEMAAPGQLRKAGVSRSDRGGLKAGDEVTITALAARNGSNTGLVQILKTADGREFDLRPDLTATAP